MSQSTTKRPNRVLAASSQIFLGLGCIFALNCLFSLQDFATNVSPQELKSLIGALVCGAGGLVLHFMSKY